MESSLNFTFPKQDLEKNEKVLWICVVFVARCWSSSVSNCFQAWWLWLCQHACCLLSNGKYILLQCEAHYTIVRKPSTAQVDYKQYLFFSIVHCEYERDLRSNEHHFDSSNILLSYTHSHLFTTSWVYLEPVWPAPNWLVSSGGRVLHWYCRGHRFESRTGLNFFQALFSLLLK